MKVIPHVKESIPCIESLLLARVVRVSARALSSSRFGRRRREDDPQSHALELLLSLLSKERIPLPHDRDRLSRVSLELSVPATVPPDSRGWGRVPVAVDQR